MGLMTGRRHRHLPVVADGKLVGLISIGDVVKSMIDAQEATIQSLEKYITGRSMVYRIHSIGYFGEGGPTARVEAVVDMNQGAPRILYFRDLTDLDTPRGFDPPR